MNIDQKGGCAGILGSEGDELVYSQQVNGENKSRTYGIPEGKTVFETAQLELHVHDARHPGEVDASCITRPFNISIVDNLSDQTET